jgi:hypothetical protein
MAGMFKKAAKIDSKPTAKVKKEKEQIEISGLRQLTLLDALIKQATAMQATLKAEVNAAGFEKFAAMAGGGNTRPSSFEGVDGEYVTASVEVRKRSAASVLTEDEVKVLREHDIEPFTQVTTQHLFAINPKYAGDEALLGRVEKAIEKIVPEDFIVEQDEVSRQVVSDDMLDMAFKTGKPSEVLAMMVTMAVKPKLSAEYDMANLLSDAMEIMQPKKKAAPAKRGLTKMVG